MNLFCAIAGLKVNPSNPAVVVFQPPHYKINEVVKRSLKLSFDGVPLPVVAEYRYLAMVFNNKKNFQHAANSLIMPGNKAMQALLTGCRKNILNIPNFVLRFIDILIKPVTSYGSQIWGVDCFLNSVKNGAAGALQNNKLEKIQLSFICCISGASKWAGHWVLLKEFNRYPLQVNWIIYSFFAFGIV